MLSIGWEAPRKSKERDNFHARDHDLEETDLVSSPPPPMTSVVPPVAPDTYAAKFDDFDETLARALKDHAEVIVYLYASRDPATNLSWCPDCQRSDEFLRRSFAKAQKEGLKVPAFVDAPVGPRECYKNNPDHPYRKHPVVRLTCVPTIIRWSKTGPGLRVHEPSKEAEVWGLLFPAKQ